MRSIVLVLLLASLNAQAFGTKAPVPSPSPSALPSAVPSYIPVVQGVDLQPVEYYSTPLQRKRILAAGLMMNQVIKSDCFKNFISNRQMISTKGKSSAQVANHLQSLTGVIHVNMYYRRMGGIGGTSAVAYRQPPSTDINLNSAYFTMSRTVCEWASTIGHESLGHSLGEYEHTYKWNSQRIFSVPYSINEAFDACCVD